MKNILNSSKKIKLIIFGLLFISISFGTDLNSVYAEGQGKSIKEALADSGISNIEATYLPVAKNSTTPKEALADTIQAFTNVISGFAAGIAILFIVINSGKLILAVGSSDEITKAKKNIIWAGVGLLLIIFAFVIAKTVISIAFSGDFA